MFCIQTSVVKHVKNKIIPKRICTICIILVLIVFTDAIMLSISIKLTQGFVITLISFLTCSFNSDGICVVIKYVTGASLNCSSSS